MMDPLDEGHTQIGFTHLANIESLAKPLSPRLPLSLGDLDEFPVLDGDLHRRRLRWRQQNTEDQRSMPPVFIFKAIRGMPHPL